MNPRFLLPYLEFCLCLWLFIGLCAVAPNASAVVVGSATGTPAASPGGAVDPNVSTSKYTGVGSIRIIHPLGTNIATGTLISPSHVLTAASPFDIDIPSDGALDAGIIASFILNASGNESSVIDIESIVLHPDFGGFATSGANDDLAVITLSTPAPAGTGIYPLASSALGLGTTIDLVGYGQSGFGDVGYTEPPSFTVKRVGSNVADLFVVDDEGSGLHETFLYDFDVAGSNDSGFLGGVTLGNAVEVGFGGGDADGPVFVEDAGGTPVLYGVHTFGSEIEGATPPVGFFGSLGGGVLLDPYTDWIQEQIPEPSSAVLLLVAGFVGISVRRRS